MTRVHQLSGDYHWLRKVAEHAPDHAPDVGHHLSEAQWMLLRAETSCNFYWGDAWTYKTHNDLDGVAYHLARAREMLGDLANQPIEVVEEVVPQETPATRPDVAGA